MTSAVAVTDASFCQHTHLSTWAAEVWGPKLPILHHASGVIPDRLEDNNLAELTAAAEGVALAASLGAGRVLLVTDSSCVVRAVLGLDGLAAIRLRRVLAVRVKGRVPALDVRQVPGRGAGLTRDERAIGWCDRRARRVMRDVRGRLPARMVGVA